MSSRRPFHSGCLHGRVAAAGFTLVEVLVVIIVVSIAAVTLMSATSRNSEMSAQILHDQQALSLASSLLNEVEQMPSTYCDPTLDLGYATAPNVAACTVPEVLGPETGETRFGAGPGPRFNNVNDYNGYAMAAGTITDVSGTPVAATLPALSNCAATVSTAPTAFAGIVAADALLVTVTVTCPGSSTPTVLQGFRVRYAPNRS